MFNATPRPGKHLREHKENLQIIGINYGDSEESLRTFFETHRSKWEGHGYANPLLLKELRVDSYPNYILVGKDGKVIKMGIRLSELEKWLSANK